LGSFVEQLNEGQLKNYINLISELVDKIPPTETPEQRKQKFKIILLISWNPVLQKRI
jgi:hypothetical protein